MRNHHLNDIWSLARSTWNETRNRWNDDARLKYDKQITEPLLIEAEKIIKLSDEADSKLAEAERKLQSFEGRLDTL